MSRKGAEAIAHAKGYKVSNGRVVSRTGKRLSLYRDGRYLAFSVHIGNNRRARCPVHRFVAFCKFGDRIYEDGIHVRHLDGDSYNNDHANIDVGSATDNAQDKPKSVRTATAMRATSFVRTADHERVLTLRWQGLKYADIERITGLSKGHISWIVNHSQASGHIRQETEEVAA